MRSWLYVKVIDDTNAIAIYSISMYISFPHRSFQINDNDKTVNVQKTSRKMIL